MSNTRVALFASAVTAALVMTTVEAFTVSRNSNQNGHVSGMDHQKIISTRSAKFDFHYNSELNMAKDYGSDEEIFELINLSREDHENRNLLNELPNGTLKPSEEDYTIWKDDDGRPWKLNKEQNAAYHQPMPLVIAFVRGYLGKYIRFLRVPNLKFISPNADGRYSEVIANRKTGELVIDQQLIGTFNFATDAPNAMDDGKLPTTGEHDTLDVIPHSAYGFNYKHVAAGIELASIKKGPIVLGHFD